MLVNGDGRVAVGRERRGSAGSSAGSSRRPTPLPHPSSLDRTSIDRTLNDILSASTDTLAALNIPPAYHLPLLLLSTLLSLTAALRLFKSLSLLIPLWVALRLTVPAVEEFDVGEEVKRALRKVRVPPCVGRSLKSVLELCARSPVRSNGRFPCLDCPWLLPAKRRLRFRIRRSSPPLRHFVIAA